jgi:hypothetical protein
MTPDAHGNALERVSGASMNYPEGFCTRRVFSAKSRLRSARGFLALHMVDETRAVIQLIAREWSPKGGRLPRDMLSAPDAHKIRVGSREKY